MKTRSRAAVTTTMVATVASPPNAPRRASARARHTVSAPSASAAPRPNVGPLVPAKNPCAKPHANAKADASAAARSRPSHAKTVAASAATMSGANAMVAANAGHCVVDPASAKPSADGPPPAAHGTSTRATSAVAANAGVARSRDAGTNVAGAVVVTPGYFGSVETSLSHFVSRRVRSADEPYFA